MLHTALPYNRGLFHNYFSTDISEMIGEQGKTCVSIIIPTHRTGEGRQGDRIAIQDAIATARKQIPGDSVKLIDALLDLFMGIDYTHNKEGIGFFVSPSVKKLVKFPFPVSKKIVVDQYFDLQDLLYTENYCVEYYVLDISKKEIHLFRGLLDRLEEIKDNHFPKMVTEEYEYSKPSHSRTDAGYAHVKNFEKDKSILSQIRLKKVFQEVDKSLSNYLSLKTIPLLICGPERDIAIFKSSTKHADNIVGSMSDNYKGVRSRDLALLSWLKIRTFIDEKKRELVSEVKEKVADQSIIFAPAEILSRLKREKNSTLLLEKDPGTSQPSQNANGVNVHSAGLVNEITTTVLRKSGKIVILEQDTLESCGIHGKMALILQ